MCGADEFLRTPFPSNSKNQSAMLMFAIISMSFHLLLQVVLRINEPQ